MTKVADFAAEREARTPHMEGEAVCLACRNAWQAVAPVGTTELECPECRLPRGVWHHGLAPEDDTLIWMCNNCGGDLFYLGEVRTMCATCGLPQDWEPAT